MNTRLLSLVGLLLILGQAFAETTPIPGHPASRLAVANSTYTTIASSLNPSTVGAAVTFTSTTKYLDFRFSDGSFNAGTNQVNSAGANAAGGQVIIEDLGTVCPAGNILYVNANATGANDGSSWTNAFTKLQDALALTNSCTSISQIWVAKGTYFPDEGGGFVDNNITAAFTMKNNLGIYGGFSGNGTETLLSQRDWMANPTILSGDINKNNNPDNAVDSRHVIFNNFTSGAPLSSSAVLDGFTISGGYGSGYSGGGMYNKYASPTISHCNFSNNRVLVSNGGGMYNEDCSPTISYCTFSNNEATGGGYGGGMHNRNASPNISHCTFSNNLSSGSGYGGSGMANFFSSSPTVSYCTFSDNRLQGSSDGAMLNDYSSPVVSNCIFSRNQFSAMYNRGTCTASIVNCTFSANTAFNTYGGGMTNNLPACQPTVKNCIFWGNGTLEIVNFNGAAPVVTYCDVKGGYTGTGNINADPLFVNAGDFHLQSGSPAINAGTNTGAPATDIEGNPRALTVADPADMGAYEKQACKNTYYVDADGDGYGSTTTALLCDATAPAGYSTTNTDCNDADRTVHEPQLYYVDADGDGVGSAETKMLCSSTAPQGYSTTNTDGCPTDPLKQAAGACGCGIADTDSDGDGTPNCLDACPNDPNKIATGACGCGVADTDTDSDGIADCNDPCPLAISGITNFDPATCGCATGFTPVMNGNVITSCQCTLEVSLGSACRQVYAGYDEASNTTVLTATATGQDGSDYTYLWSNGATSASITVSPATTTIYSVTVSKSGCSATGSVTVNVINVACEKNKVQVCHNGKTLCVSKTGKNGVAEHLAHGDKLGSCDTQLPCGSANSRVATYEPTSELPTEGWLAYPNPFEQTLTLQLHATTAGSADIVLVDMVGRSVVSKKQLLVEGSNRIVLETGRVAPGVYIVQLTDAASVVRTLKVLKK